MGKIDLSRDVKLDEQPVYKDIRQPNTQVAPKDQIDLSRDVKLDEQPVAKAITQPNAPVTPKERLNFAYFVLGGVSILMLAGWAVKSFVPYNIGEVSAICKDPSQEACKASLALLENKKAASEGIFEFVKTWLPPLVTLILGYYFGTRESIDSPSNNA